MPFQEPTDMRRDMMSKTVLDWKSDDQCPFWTRQCVRLSQREISVLPFEEVGPPGTIFFTAPIHTYSFIVPSDEYSQE
eukprot:scaffold140795_cov18-Prasinocladus_malaysianus.AAC.1